MFSWHLQVAGCPHDPPVSSGAYSRTRVDPLRRSPTTLVMVTVAFSGRRNRALLGAERVQRRRPCRSRPR